MGKLLLGKEKIESRVAEALRFGQAIYSAGIMHLCRACKTANYPQSTEIFLMAV